MRRTKGICCGVLVWTIVASLAADVWDDNADADDGVGTDNELVHGTDQLHDLAVRPGPVADQDWYLIGQARHSSYEVIIDSTSGDIGFGGLTFGRVASDGTTVLQSAGSIAIGYSRSLRWANLLGSFVGDQFVRVADATCTTACGADDVYRIRAYETTVSVARFNNSGTQITVLLAQNPTDSTVSGTVFFWNATGTLLTSTAFSINAKSLLVLSTGSIGALAGTSGSITIAHNAPYGMLNVKAVALEPATGFSFDTPGVHRPK